MNIIVKNLQDWTCIFSNALGPWKKTYSNNLKMHHFSHKNFKIWKAFFIFLTKVTLGWKNVFKKKKKSKQDTTTSFETLSKTTSGLKKNHWYQSFAPSSLTSRNQVLVNKSYYKKNLTRYISCYYIVKYAQLPCNLLFPSHS